MYEYVGTLTRVVDGDTVDLALKKVVVLDVDFGFYVKDKFSFEKSAEIRFRLVGINAPEVTGSEKPAGLTAKDYLQKLLENRQLKVVSYKPDKYGRWLAEIFINDNGEEKSVNRLMLESGHAVVYNP